MHMTNYMPIVRKRQLFEKKTEPVQSSTVVHIFLFYIYIDFDRVYSVDFAANVCLTNLSLNFA